MTILLGERPGAAAPALPRSCYVAVEMPARARAPNAGGTVRTIKIGDATANARQWYGFSVKLKRGACEWCVCATDLAGKPQANGGKAAFTAK